jgi:succinate dehydrogenase / fumarate reductase membrane anchor subunit
MKISSRLSKGYFNFPSKNHGSFHWILQRVTGALLVFLSGWFLSSLLTITSFDYDHVLNWLSNPWTAAVMTGFIGLILWHGYLGMEVIVDDYVKNALWHGSCKFLLRLSVSVGLLAAVWVFFELAF